MIENCYIYWDGDEIAEEDRYIYFQCEECHKQNGRGIFWAKEFGYNYGIACCNCKKEIYKKEDNDKTK